MRAPHLHPFGRDDPEALFEIYLGPTAVDKFGRANKGQHHHAQGKAGENVKASVVAGKGREECGEFR
jgi:hypothetical protein